MRNALTRRVPATFSAALHGSSGRAPDTRLARQQHHQYRSILESYGYNVTVLAADDAHPDCVFVEDVAVVLGDVAVATNPGATSRRGEVGPVADALRQNFAVETIFDPGTLDGGDVLRMGDTVYVGLSDRTNAVGAAQLSAIAANQGLDTVQVPVSNVLHLKSGVLAVDEETIVVTPETVDEGQFDRFRVIYEDPGERHQFSCLVLGSGQILATSSAPQTTESVAKLGIDVYLLDASEILAADGGLTCMSILYDTPGR